MKRSYRHAVWWFGILTLAGCGFSFEPAYPIIHPRSLLLRDQELPTGCEELPCDAACDATQLPGHALLSYSRWTIAGAVLQDVYAHRTSAEAEQRFNAYRSVIFRRRELPDVTLVPNADIPFHSRYAQQETIGCGYDDGISLCQGLFRYHNYVVELYFDWATPLDKQGMEAQQIHQVFQALDDRIGRCLVAPTATAPC